MDASESDRLADALRAGPASAELLAAANKAASQLYWERKDAAGCHGLLGDAIAAARRSLAVCAAGDRRELELALKRLLYNRASYGWLGWDEPGIVLEPAIQRAAVDAAREHLELAGSLGLPPLPMSRAHWLAGALLLQAGAPDSARQHFAEAEALAGVAQEPAEAANAAAFACVCEVLLGRPAARQSLDAAVERLRGLTTDDALVRQAPTALRVFLPR